MTEPSDSLSDLIDAAAKQAARPAVSVSRATRRDYRGVAIALSALAGVLVAWQVWSILAPPRDAQVQRDLGEAVEMARDSIESSRRTNGGALPERIPNAALATAVRYEQADGSYRLVASAMGIRVTLEPDGSRRAERDTP
jgi:hypothetical protein